MKTSTITREGKKIVILERYCKIDGVVYRQWRYYGDKEWRNEPTPLRDIPYVIIVNLPI